MNIRQKKLLNKLMRVGFLSIAEESAIHNVSQMTIRRDIVAFEQQGLAVRTHGGAVPRTAGADQLAGSGRPSETQKLIARRIVEMLADGTTIMLSTGSTTLEVARQLAASDRQLSVITNSLPVAAALFKTPLQVILTGGILRNESLDLVGPVAEKNIEEYYIDLLVAGCDGAIAEEGFFTKDLNLASMERKSAQQSQRITIVTESRKFGTPAFVKFTEMKDVHTVVTDSDLSPEDHKLMTEAGVEVVICHD